MPIVALRWMLVMWKTVAESWNWLGRQKTVLMAVGICTAGLAALLQYLDKTHIWETVWAFAAAIFLSSPLHPSPDDEILFPKPVREAKRGLSDTRYRLNFDERYPQLPLPTTMQAFRIDGLTIAINVNPTVRWPKLHPSLYAYALDSM